MTVTIDLDALQATYLLVVGGFMTLAALKSDSRLRGANLFLVSIIFGTFLCGVAEALQR